MKEEIIIRDIVEDIKDIRNRKKECYYTIDFESFKKYYSKICGILNCQQGLIMISENIAICCFDNCTYLKIIIESKSVLFIDDFIFCGNNFSVVGRKHRKSFYERILGDLKHCIKIIIFCVVIFLFLFLSSESTMDKLGTFIQILINIVSVFIAALFVFIGMFYGDKERAIMVYKKGNCDDEYETDKYVIVLSFIALSFLMISYGITIIGNIHFDIPLIDSLLYKISIIDDYYIAVILTGNSLILIIICFDSLICYYLRTCRNEFFVEAFKDSMDERRHGLK